MRDSLLDGASAYLMSYRNAGESGRREAEELAEADDLVAGLVDWCRLLMRDTNVVIDWEEGQGFSELLLLPSDLSPLRAIDKIADIDQRHLLRGGLSGLLENSERRDINVMAWLLGKAIAESLVEHLENSTEAGVGLVPGLQNLASAHDVTHYAFEKCLQLLLRDHPSAFAAMLSELEWHIDAIMQNPGIGTYSSERETFNQTIEAWRTKPSTDELWRTSGHWIPLQYRMLDLVPIFISVGRTEILKQLDRFDFPHPVRRLLEDPSILHDRDEIAAILEESASCSDDGQTWNQRLTPLLVLETVETHCRELWRVARIAQEDGSADENIIPQTQDTLSSWLHQLGAIVMARQDGQFLGTQWLLRQFADERRERARGRYLEDGGTKTLRQEQVIEWTALGLCEAGLQGHHIEAVARLPEGLSGGGGRPERVARSDEGSENPWLGTLSMSTLLDHMIRESSSQGVGKLLEQFDTLLALRDKSFEIECILTTASGGLPANCCGYLFARTDSPVERWQQSWNQVVEQRRRAQHWHETKDGDALAPSLFLLTAGTAAVEWLISFRDQNMNDKKELWRAVFDGARDCWLTVSIAPLSEQIEKHVGRLFALHPRVFDVSAAQIGVDSRPAGSNVAESYSERLAEDLFALGGDDLVLVVSLLNAGRNGASLATMSEVLKWREGHVDNVLKQFEKWQQVERSMRRRPDLITELGDLRAQIAQYEKVG